VIKQQDSFLDKRRTGILLHPSSLPGIHGGDLGENAFRFVDFLVQAQISVWQTLPLSPAHEEGSPYNSLSAHAINPSFISLELLVKQGWLDDQTQSVEDYPQFHHQSLDKARTGFIEKASQSEKEDFDHFIKQQQSWLKDYALFRALRAKFNTHWIEWPAEWRDLKKNNEVDTPSLSDELEQAYQQTMFDQYIVFSQWHALRNYANEQGVLLFGDVPIFVAHDSADVWAKRNQFLLDETGNPQVVAGVPPDYFSETGQRWGNPLYNWQKMTDDGFQWWIARMHTQLDLFDLLRVDHFRGFEAYWEIAADCETAIEGHWVKAPGDELFRALKETCDSLPVIAEDLGVITAEVTALRNKYQFPGMKILQFAFDGNNENAYLPHHHEKNGVVYTGTHDNDTTLGWHETQSPEHQAQMMNYMSHPQEPMPWPLIQMALNSKADLAMIPMQDILVLDTTHRMNTPGTITEKNWCWQFSWNQINEGLTEKLKTLITNSNRT